MLPEVEVEVEVLLPRGMLCPGPNWQQRAPKTSSPRKPERKQSRLGAFVTVKITKWELEEIACRVSMKKSASVQYQDDAKPHAKLTISVLYGTGTDYRSQLRVGGTSL